MNKRIKELEAQCWEPRKHPASQAALGDKFNTEKFAELIVRECADWIENEEDEQGDYIHDSFYWSPRLLKHFGVEE